MSGSPRHRPADPLAVLAVAALLLVGVVHPLTGSRPLLALPAPILEPAR